MQAIIIDGRKVRDSILIKLSKEVELIGISPCLIILQVGDNKESDAYVKQKVLFGTSIGAKVLLEKIEDNVHAQRKILARINKLNTDNNIHGIIVQLPLPNQIEREKVLSAISPMKDVDGLHKENLGLLMQGFPRFVPATARGIFSLLDFYKISVAHKKVVVLGRSNLVGKPVALLALARNSTVTVCHSETKNISQHTKLADILIVATGKAGLIGKEHVSPGQIIVDVGIHTNTNNGKRTQSGDVRFDEVLGVVGGITPVPGGVGPMTVASLFENLIDALKISKKLSQ